MNKVMFVFLINTILVCSSGCEYSNKNRPKVLLIGVDGASWNVMTPLIKKGKLPNIKKLMDRGSWGNCESVWPFYSEVVWTSITTGKLPAKHGITDRLLQDPDTGVAVPPTSNLKKVKAIWDILSESNKRVGIMNFMVTWPAEKVNGVVISDRILDINGLDYLAEDRSYPNFKEICSPTEFERFKNIKESIFSGIKEDRFPNFWWSIENIDNFMINFSKYLLRKKNFDFFCLYIRGIDIASYNFWQFLFPEGLHISEDDIQRYKDIINNYYIWCDRVIGDIFKEAGKDTVVFIVSDHGFTATPKYSRLFSKVDYLLEISEINKISEGSQTAILKNEPADIHSFGKNIEIIGNLSEKEFSELREKAKNTLKNIVVKETGDHLFSNLEDTKNGFLIKAPKSFMEKNLAYHIIVNKKEYKINDLFINNVYLGEHSNPAIIIISGEHILRNKKIMSANIYDITPTILYYMGIPIAKDMDGKVLLEAIEEDYIKRNPIRYIDTYETAKDKTVQKPIRSLFDEERIKEKMRSLGYIN